MGASTGADETALWDLLHAALAGAGLDPGAISALATLDRKASEPAIVAVARRLGVPLKTFEANDLTAVAAPNPSAVVAAAVGTASVAEAAAILGAGPGATLVAPKVVSATRDSTVALARRRLPEGHLSVVGLGPGEAAQRTPAASAAVGHAEVVIGYAPYLDLAGDLLRAGQTLVPSPIGAEAERAQEALARAGSGQRVALVCSGDAGVYAMASLVFELAPRFGEPPISVIAGIPAAVSGAALLGAPIGHDHAAISLSDLLTPWEVIRCRLQAAADGDFVVSLYNPRSARRTSQLAEAVGILAARRPGTTPAAVLTDIGRPGQRVTRTTLAALDTDQVDMRSLVVIGSTTTRWISGRMVTPRGYQVAAS
jgi:cobalt-precorrin 5A hydrolase/precorrin-3B C17-methyltransferase